MYAGTRSIERSLQLQDLPPAEAMRRLVQVTFDDHAAHPDWIRLIAVANIHGAHHIRDLPTIASQNSAIAAVLQEVLARGERDNVFRGGVDPLHLHLTVNSMCFCRVSNRHTWRVISGRDLSLPDDVARQRAMLAVAVLSYLALDSP